MFDNFNVNLRKNEGFLTYIPCIPVPEYGQSNAPLNQNLSRERIWFNREERGSIEIYCNENCQLKFIYIHSFLALFQ